MPQTDTSHRMNISTTLGFVVGLLFLSSAENFSFNIPQFDSNSSDVVYEGDGKTEYNHASLTEVSSTLLFRVGRVVYSKPVHLWDSSTNQVADFTCHFTFKIEIDDDNFSDGLAFFMAPVDYPIPPNSGGGYLGLLNSTTGNSSNNQIVIVEFDTYNNWQYDPQGLESHVGININMISSVNFTGWDARSCNQQSCNCWITYDSSNKILCVFWTSEQSPVYVLSYPVDLTAILPEIKLGFSAATGLAMEHHIINSWNFSSNLDNDASPPPSENHNKSARKTKFNSAWIVILVVGFFILLMAGLLGYKALKMWNSRKAASKGTCAESCIEIGNLPRRFSYQELVTATNGFASDRKLGQGVLSDLGCLVAVKRISTEFKHSERFFINEVKIVSRLIHQNLVQLLGWCHEQGEFILVYEYMSNGSLDYYLFGDRTLPWHTRYRIALGLALALHYLHEEAGHCVIHRDIKSANVLLDMDFTTKLGDFGVAKRVDSQLRTQMTAVVGTYGYLAPEYIYHGRLSKASDLFSFGVVALEIACGRKTYLEGEYHVPLTRWVWQLYREKNILAAADERLKMVFSEKEMECLVVVGLWCTHPNDKQRPNVGEVIKVLEFEAPLPVLPEDMYNQDYLPPNLLPLPSGSRTSSTN
ncbi:LOW QUALITY PROTEIN: hypothetical protein BT93_L1647 [Corymbia citriodora subsp. variegata]|uniref:Protein kinase domain-containing protein n=1 Tax=Corymbia citriodora subsp. variegata TaxID=360336 RepID=A0A8T0D0I7_CORYI|nr:LOW QUALITY PROTEIN: hypothetical protein BT93_L1647 [Corymbia citriodora subsp. variegata]